MECEFCKKTFSTKSNLTSHQKSAKFCLNLQGENNDNEKKFTCEYCQKTLTQQKSLDVHILSCKEKKKTMERTKEAEQALIIKRLEMEIIKLKKSEKEKLREKNDYIVKLETKLEKFENVVTNMAAATTQALEVKTAKASTTNNTTLNTNITVNNVLNLSQEHVKKVLSERLDYNVVYAGQAGLAMFVFNNILKDATGKLIYRCVDASRQMFEFVDENGETVRDMKAEKLTQSLLKGDVIKLGLEAAAVGWNTENEKLNTERVGVFGPKVNEYADLNRNNTVFRAKVSSLTA